MKPRVMAVKVLRGLRLNRIASQLYYRHVHGFASAGKELPDVVYRCMEKAKEFGNHERGDYYEFGIFKGHTFWRAQQSANKLGLSRMRFFGFDSFAGLPAPEGFDVTENEDFYDAKVRMQNLPFIRKMMHEYTLSHTVDEIVEQMSLARIPVNPLGDGRTLLEMDHLLERETFILNPAGFKQPRPPYRLSDDQRKRGRASRR